uniref:GCN5-related N-acetyltransferase n=1 Tax=Cyanothece sp. (strain PCC 7425 / ATCC 29141) TaxID=395961 RepID=B8HP11_CYAP4
MALELIPLDQHHVPELGRICHEAFSALQERHGVARDIPDLDTGLRIISHVAARSDYSGVVAAIDGRIVGSNFLLHSDFVAGVGPLTVDPQVQSRGVGRALMQWVINEADRRGIRQLRLFQEAINTTSLSLYTALGFDWRGSAVLMQAQPASTDDPSIRPLSVDDLDSIALLSRTAYGFSRAGDAAQLLAAQIPGFLRQRDGRAVGYLISSLFGHGGAETEEDLFALIAQAARQVPPQMAAFICPLSRPEAFRRALAAGHRTIKLLSYMSLGDFTEPGGAYLPSIQC